MDSFDTLMDDVVVKAKGGGKKGKKGGGGGGGGNTGKMNGARGGGKRTSKRDVQQNKKVSCYSSKHVRLQTAAIENQQKREPKQVKKKN